MAARATACCHRLKAAMRPRTVLIGGTAVASMAMTTSSLMRDPPWVMKHRATRHRRWLGSFS